MTYKDPRLFRGEKERLRPGCPAVCILGFHPNKAFIATGNVSEINRPGRGADAIARIREADSAWSGGTRKNSTIYNPEIGVRTGGGIKTPAPQSVQDSHGR